MSTNYFETGLDISNSANDAELISVYGKGEDDLQSTGLTEAKAKDRAEKLDYLLGDKSPGLDVLEHAYRTGSFPKYEKLLADDEFAKQQKAKEEVITAYVDFASKNDLKPDVEYLKQVSAVADQPVDADIVAEKRFAKEAVNKLVTATGTENPELIVKAEEEDPNLIDKTNVAEELIAKQEYTKKLLGRAEATVSDEDWGSWLMDQAGALFSVNEYVKMTDVLPDAPSDSWLLGGTVRDKIEYLWSLSPEEFKDKLNDAYEQLAEKNPVIAKAFVEKVLSYSSANEVLDSIGMVSDVVDIATGFGAGLKVGAKVGLKAAAKSAGKAALKKETETAVADAVKNSLRVAVRENAKDGVSVDSILAATGHTKQAAYTKAFKDFLSDAAGDVTGETVSSIARKKDLYEKLKDLPVSIINPYKYIDEKDITHLPLTDAIKQVLKRNADILQTALTSVPRVARIDEGSPVLQQLIEETQAKLARMHKKTSDAILDARLIHSDNTIDNVNKVEFVLGKPTKEVFTTAKEAQMWNNLHYRLPKGSYTIERKGGGFVIKAVRDVDETTDAFRKAALETENKVNESPVVAILNRLASADAALGSGAIEARKTGAFGSQKLADLFHEVLKDFEGLPKKSMQDFNKFLEANAFAMNENGTVGKAFDNFGDFQSAYQKLIGRPPTDKEYVAYDSFRKLMDFDFAVRNLSIRRDLARRGVETVMIKTGDEPIEFYGKVVDDIPWSMNDEGNIVFITKEGDIHHWRKNAVDSKSMETLQRLVEEDKVRVVQLADSSSLPFAKWLGSKRVHFAIVDKQLVSTKPLPYQFLNYNPGAGHIIYRDEFFTKLPMFEKGKGMRKVLYNGDVTIASHTTQKEAQVFADKLNELFKMWAEGNKAGVRTKLADGVLPITYDDFKNIVKHTKHVDPELTRFYPVQNGRRVIDELKNFGDTIEDLDNSPFDLVKGTMAKFMSDRDPIIRKVVMEGTEKNPVFKLSKPKLMSVRDMLNTTLRDDVDMLLERDVKTRSIEDFFRQFGEYVKNYDPNKGNLAEAFANPQWDEKAADPKRLKIAKNAWATLRNYWSQPSYMDTVRQYARTRWMNFVLNTGGPKAAQIYNDYALPFIKSPFEYARAAAFQLHIALWNAKQVLQQSMGTVNVLAFSEPEFVWPAVGDVFPILIRFYRGNAAEKELLKHLVDKRMNVSKIKKLMDKNPLTPAQMEEMIESAYNSGFLVTKHEYIDVSDTNIAAYVRKTRNKIADSSLMFFRAGERFPKALAWSVAYREWRAANKTAKFNDAAMREILNRADRLVGSMSRASRNAPQEGIASIMTQFLTYSFHISEQFFSAVKNNPWKAMQAFFVYSFMFGVPGGFQSATLIPVHDAWRKFLLQYDEENGTDYANYANHPIIGLLSQGMVGQAITMATDRTYNFTQTYGPMGLQPVDYALDLISNEKDPQALKEFILSIVGAGPKTVYTMAESLRPFWRWTVSYVAGPADGTKYQLTSDDFLNVFKNVSIVKDVSKAMVISALHKHVFKREYVETDNPKLDALFAAIGMTPQEVLDHFNRKDIMRGIEKTKKKLTGEIEQQLLRMYLEEDEEKAEVFYRNALVLAEIAGLNELEKAEIISRALLKAYNQEPDVKYRFMKAINKQKD